MSVNELHSEKLREEVTRLVAESGRLRKEAKNNELQMRAIAARLAEIEREMVAQTAACGLSEGLCVEWQPGRNSDS